MYTSSTMSNLLGPNSYGVPENYPRLQANASCAKCHGTGYKKALLTRKWKACKKCANMYGTNISTLNLEAIPIQPVAGTTVIGSSVPMTTGTTYMGTTAPMTTGTTYMSTSAPMTTGFTSTSTIPATSTVYTSAPMSSNLALPAGFQTLPANAACKKCHGLGYKQSKKAGGPWKGCKPCAKQYGTNLKTLVIPSVSMAQPMGTTTTTYVSQGGNINY